MMSDFLFSQYKNRGGILCREEFDENQLYLKQSLQVLLSSQGITIGEFCAACADVIAESAENHTKEIAHVLSLALDVSEDIRGVALERGNGGNA